MYEPGFMEFFGLMGKRFISSNHKDIKLYIAEN